VTELHAVHQKAMRKSTQLIELLTGIPIRLPATPSAEGKPSSGTATQSGIGNAMVTSISLSTLHTELHRIANRRISAELLLYNYAIDKCQTAALDEMFGNPIECFKQYNMARAVLHCLAEQTTVASDKELFAKCTSCNVHSSASDSLRSEP
jgi:hypothetical protein